MAGEKRSAAEVLTTQEDKEAILLDVEGTTTSISFVQDTLFPYVREFLKKHVDEKWSTEEFKDDFAKLKEQAKEDEEKKIDGFVPIKEDNEDEAKESLIKNILWQMDNDRKTGALKQLQGNMWKAAHKPIKGHVYDDVPKAFEEWTNSGKKLYIYSSGSVQAQKLLFGDSVHGDLLKYISGHFDTEVGPKQDPESYKNILKKIDFEPSNVVFLTDVVKEAEAAKAAGLSTTLVIREGNAKLSDEDKTAYKTIESFAELSFESTSTKRPKLEEKPVEKEEKEVGKEEKKEETPTAAATEPASEITETTEDVEMAEVEKKTETPVDLESKVENTADDEKAKKEIVAEKEENVEKESTPMEDQATKTESEEKMETATEEKANGDVTEKIEEVEKETKIEENKKTDDSVTVETVKESLTEKIVEDEVTNQKGKDELTEKKVEETKLEDKEAPVEEIKENGEAESKPIDDKIDENKENVQSTEETVKKNEPEIELAEEAKEIENPEKETEKKETVLDDTDSKKVNGTTANGDSTKDEDDKVHTNGVTVEAAQEEDSIKVKKPVADGAGESDVVTAPPVVVAATS